MANRIIWEVQVQWLEEREDRKWRRFKSTWTKGFGLTISIYKIWITIVR